MAANGEQLPTLSTPGLIIKFLHKNDKYLLLQESARLCLWVTQLLHADAQLAQTKLDEPQLESQCVCLPPKVGRHDAESQA